MNGKSMIIPIETALHMSEEDFEQMLEEQERLSQEEFTDKALEQFVSKPEESHLSDKINLINFISLFLLLCIICAVSIISSIKGSMEPYVAAPIAVLSVIGIVILAKDAKKYK